VLSYNVVHMQYINAYTFLKLHFLACSNCSDFHSGTDRETNLGTLNVKKKMARRDMHPTSVLKSVWLEKFSSVAVLLVLADDE